LHVSQPALSQQIGQLKHTLHAPLLDRSGCTIALTDAGVAYLATRVVRCRTSKRPPCDPRHKRLVAD
jgi:Bacterial regulatory helix-turn-helix protein, lysR family